MNNKFNKIRPAIILLFFALIFLNAPSPVFSATQGCVCEGSVGLIKTGWGSGLCKVAAGQVPDADKKAIESSCKTLNGTYVAADFSCNNAKIFVNDVKVDKCDAKSIEDSLMSSFGISSVIMGCIDKKVDCKWKDIPKGAFPVSLAGSAGNASPTDASSPASSGAGSASQSSPSQISSLISKCGADTLPAECKDISVFVEVLLQIVSYLFGIIGALALGMFVYGGFVLILSQGNPEKVKQGTGAMINAVIGLAIAFGGYVLISFLSDAIGVKTDFRLK